LNLNPKTLVQLEETRVISSKRYRILFVLFMFDDLTF